MDNNTLAIIIAIAIGFLTIAASIIAVGVMLSRQSSRHDDAIAALNVKVDNLRIELSNQIREYAYAIENRINLDERVREVEQRTARPSDD